MKKSTFVVAIALATCSAGSAHAQFFGQMHPLGDGGAEGKSSFGVYAGLASAQMGVTGQYRMSKGNSSIGMQAGFSHFSIGNSYYGEVASASGVGGRADLSMDLAHPASSEPNLHLGGEVAAGVRHWSGVTSFGISITPELSYEGKAGPGKSFFAMGGLGLDYASSTLGVGSGVGAHLRIGGGYNFSSSMGVAAEMTGGQFMVGINFGGAGTLPTPKVAPKG